MSLSLCNTNTYTIPRVLCACMIFKAYSATIPYHMITIWLYTHTCTHTTCTVLNAELFSKSRTHWLNMTQHSAMLPAQGSEGVRQAQKSKTDLSLHVRPCWSFCVAMLQWLGYVGMQPGWADSPSPECGTGSLQISCSLRWGQIRAMPLVPIRRMAGQRRLWSHETWNLKVRAQAKLYGSLRCKAHMIEKMEPQKHHSAALHKQSQWQCSFRSWSVAKVTMQKASKSIRIKMHQKATSETPANFGEKLLFIKLKSLAS